MVKIYPNFNAYYYSFYLESIMKRYNKIKFTKSGFNDFHQHSLALIIDHLGKNYKIYISAGDGPGLNQLGLKWCDVYAKVNMDNQNVPIEYHYKVLPIGPSFGINYLDGFQTIYHSLKTYIKSNPNLVNSREHFANYYRQWKYRVSIEKYNLSHSLDNYIFHASTLWRKEITTNNLRANFMELANEDSSITFEGGFAPGKQDISERFNKLTLKNKYSNSEYIKKTKGSFAVFNTQAVQGCFGWKLGEYLALGKAIISTPLKNILPSPLIHREHIHFVNGDKKSISNAIEEIRYNHNYRLKLEKNARQYFLKNLSPDSVIERILCYAKESSE